MKQIFSSLEEAEQFALNIPDRDNFVFNFQPLPDNGGFGVEWIEKKYYVSYTGETYPDECWVTEKGEMVFIQDLEPEHARNVIRMIIRNNREYNKQFTQILQKIYNSDIELDEEISSEEIDNNFLNSTTPKNITYH